LTCSIVSRILSGVTSSIREEMGMTDEKVRENRLRRMADRQGLALRKSGRRDPRALDYGMYALIDPKTNTHVAGAQSGRYDLTIDDVEEYLTGEDR
jgi:hypothetical protein